MRQWWANLTPEERRAKTARRDAARVRASDAKKHARRRITDEQKAKIAARLVVTHAIESGRLLRGDCEVGVDCEGRIEAHHDDYSRPLDVRWLCRKHHRIEDGQT